MSCGICGSKNTGGGSWSGDWCNDCGAKEIVDEWQPAEPEKVECGCLSCRNNLDHPQPKGTYDQLKQDIKEIGKIADAYHREMMRVKEIATEYKAKAEAWDNLVAKAVGSYWNKDLVNWQFSFKWMGKREDALEKFNKARGDNDE